MPENKGSIDLFSIRRILQVYKNNLGFMHMHVNVLKRSEVPTKQQWHWSQLN